MVDMGRDLLHCPCLGASGEDSVYTEVDRIFQEYGANRSHYFGAFQGVDIRKIMNVSEDLFGVDGKIGKCLLLHVERMSK